MGPQGTDCDGSATRHFKTADEALGCCPEAKSLQPSSTTTLLLKGLRQHSLQLIFIHSFILWLLMPPPGQVRVCSK